MNAQMDSREYRELQAEYRALRALNAELVDALEQLVVRYGYGQISPWLENARAAIAKAKSGYAKD